MDSPTPDAEEQRDSPTPPEPPETESSSSSTRRRDPQSAAVVRSAFLVGALTALSRFAGLLREATLARFLGTGISADAFRIGFLLPGLIRRLVGDGAATSAFVAVYTRETRTEGDQTDDQAGIVFAEKFLTLWMFLVAAVVVLGVLVMGLAFQLVSPWLSGQGIGQPENLALTVTISRILFVYLFFVGTLAGVQGVLNARWKFGAPAFVSTLFNLVFVGSSFALVHLYPQTESVFLVSFAVLAGGFVQLTALGPSLWKIGIRPRLRNPLNHSGVREVLRLMIPGVLGGGVYQLNVALNSIIAMRLPEGSVSSLAFSNRFMEFVLGVFVVALSTVSLTAMAQRAAAGDRHGLAERSSEVLRLVLFITIPSTVGLLLLGRPVISLILQWGAFQEDSLRMTLGAFRYHIVALTFIGVIRVLVAGFHAQKDLRTPVLVACATMPFNVLLAFGLSSTAMVHTGIACAASSAAIVHAVVLFVCCRRKLPELQLGPILSSLVKTILAAAMMGVGCFVIMSLVPAPETKLKLAAWVLLLVGSGAATFFFLARWMRMAECGWLFDGVFRRRG